MKASRLAIRWIARPNRRRVPILRPSAIESTLSQIKSIPRFLSTAPQVANNDDNYEAHVNENGKEIVVFFNNNNQARFHAPWLWSNDPAHVHATSGQRIRSPGDYPGTSIESVSIVSGTNCGYVPPTPGSLHPIGGIFANDSTSEPPPWLLKITWKSNIGRERTFFDLEWLKERVYCEEATKATRESSEVTPRHALTRIKHDRDSILKVNFHALEKDLAEERTFQLLHGIVQKGAAIVHDAPVISTGHDASVRRLGHWLAGSLSHGALYGDIFQVKSMPSAHNLAYTNVHLPPHIDMGYYESPPGLQILHCISNDVTGGESVLIDALAAANEFRRLCPDLFEILTTCPATFVKQRKGVDMVYRRPHIVLQGEEIVSVNWSPPFEGPLNIAPHLVQDYYVAYCAFQKMVDKHLPLEHGSHALAPELRRALKEYAEEYTWERKLTPGEMLVFNNRRMLHGRRGFSASDSESSTGRHLTGCYTSIDETMSRYRVLLRERRDEFSDFVMPNIGNGSSSSM